MTDPYARCEKSCSHDLAIGVSVSEIVSDEDGPYPDKWTGWGNRTPVGVPMNVRGWMDILRTHTMEG